MKQTQKKPASKQTQFYKPLGNQNLSKQIWKFHFHKLFENRVFKTVVQFSCGKADIGCFLPSSEFSV